MSLLGSNLYCVPYNPLPDRQKKKRREPNRKPRSSPTELRDGMRRLINRRGAMPLREVAHHLNCGPAEVWALLVDDDTLGVQWHQGKPGHNGARRTAVPSVCLAEDEPGPVQDIDGAWRDPK